MTLDFEKLFLAAPSPFVLLDRDLRILWANDAYMAATGRTREGIVGEIITDVFPSDPESESGRMLRASFRRVLENRSSDHLPLIPYPIVGASGREEKRYWSATHTPILGDGGAIYYILQHTQDVTGLIASTQTPVPLPQAQADMLRRAQEVTQQNLELDAASDYFQMIFEQAPGFMATLTGPNHIFQIANEAYTQLVGRRGLIGKPVREALPEIEGQGFFELLDQVYETGQPVSFTGAEIMLQREEHGVPERTFVDFVYQPISDPEGKTIGIFVQGHDVTAQKVAEISLREAEERFRTMAHTMPVHVWTARADGALDWLADQIYTYTGFEKGSLEGEAWPTVVHPDDRERVSAIWSHALLAGDGYESQFRIRRADGAYRWHIVRATPVRDADGNVARWLGSNADIHDQTEMARQLEELNATLEARVEKRNRELEEVHARLRESQRMEAIGNLAGGVAHDFNNLLQTMMGSLTMASRELPEDSPGRGRLSAAMRAVERAAGLSSQLLAFSRRQPLQPKSLDLKDLLSEIADIMETAVGAAVDLSVEAPEDLWPAYVDAASTENAVLNLVINARDALEGRGAIRIAMQNLTLSGKDLAGDADMSPGEFVELKVIDNGPGMSPETLERVFEPFFTTKPVGKGTGLGLSTVYGFVRQSGGRVRINSRPGAGTEVSLLLPRSKTPAEPLRQRDIGMDPRGAESILLVEDDAEVRDATVALLSDLGYSVRSARDPAAALDMFRQGAVPDMVISDVVMPGKLSSAEMVQAMTDACPGLPVLYISGYSRDAIARNGQVDKQVRFLAKPFSRGALARKVRETLDAQPSGPVVSTGKPSCTRPGAARVLVCEDDVLIRMDIVDILGGLGLEVSEASTGTEALELLRSEMFDALLVDVGLPDMSGEDVARQSRQVNPDLGVIFATGRTEVEASSDLQGSVILTKPFADRALGAVFEAIGIPLPRKT